VRCGFTPRTGPGTMALRLAVGFPGLQGVISGERSTRGKKRCRPVIAKYLYTRKCMSRYFLPFLPTAAAPPPGIVGQSAPPLVSSTVRAYVGSLSPSGLVEGRGASAGRTQIRLFHVQTQRRSVHSLGSIAMLLVGPSPAETTRRRDHLQAAIRPPWWSREGKLKPKTESRWKHGGREKQQDQSG
jgi:hypothetical protein